MVGGLKFHTSESNSAFSLDSKVETLVSIFRVGPDVDRLDEACQ
jgi:hypothetical protein